MGHRTRTASEPTDPGFFATCTVVSDPFFFSSFHSLIQDSEVHFTRQLLVESFHSLFQ